jgi:hypothetical protein
MRKFSLLLCSMLIISSVSVAQTVPQVDSSKLTIKQVYEDAKTGFKDAFTGLKQVASKLEGPAKHVYNVYTYQHRAEGYASMCVAVFIFLIGFFILANNWKESNWDSDEFNKSAFLCIPGAIISIVGIIFLGIFFGDDGLTKIINPEYFAIQDIIKAFK